MRAYHPTPATKTGALWREIGLPASRGTVLVDSIKMGFSVDVIDGIHLWASIPKAEILRATGIPSRSLTRRRTHDGRFTPEESERIARFVRVMDAAVDLFGGDKGKAITWMSTPIKGLGHRSPDSLLETETGALEVCDLIGRLEHGVFS
ncbi:DUF2384 domain-containing protein [Yersinia kristensenii]|uniref:type II toxin-antitoxin system antitoxin Xre n=1 Tax=Yersinia kristensenii TaxID=28152 RepID=UPI0001A54BF2|nr:type II toxin-antitoxin system antitoxin Xre [Yersinia kristensenii]EEP91929.1 hypothetical protein ykris0001_42000 [Yersinia kristensenii ATCC 33638]MBW5811936.1 DUF2384 domain-containing protein [Yersinia kristensenii]MBW5816630.1 DUF2384 domain-containing protein [Yersinia kristensenii]MBW5825423.1 DUF2384 domain-containing protein [Yersinia kristensenii]MBW5829476.1 DUF2384 domain-containing protein [Yersinia kristensenii]